jgi:hypothetical protein
MGNRRMAEIRTKDGSLYFYTHSAGSRLPHDAEHALQLAEPRRDDTDYALRRVVDHLIHASYSRDSEIGSGLMFDPHLEDEYLTGDWGGRASVLIDLIGWEVTVRT